MSNSAAKKARRRSNLYESEVDDLLYTSDQAPLKIKNISIEKENKKDKRSKEKNTAVAKEQKGGFGTPISSVPVKCSCNKCGEKTQGDLIGIMFCALSGLATPFISYECRSCNHIGRRSVATQALPMDQFERIYFK